MPYKYLIFLLLIFTSCTIRKDFTPESFKNNEKKVDTISENTLFDNGDLIIIRDDWGVPHIFATDMEEMHYAFGWAQMQNHGNLILRLYGQARGRSAEYWGSK